VTEAPTAPQQVATECPLCGAPLELREASNAVLCDHCGAHLLVTGRRQVLSYVLPARIEARDALARARFTIPAGERGARVGTPHLLWVPYYRMTAEVLSWRDVDDRSDRMARLRELARDLGVTPEELLASAEDTASERHVEGERLERTLLAAPGAPAAPSLGLRSQALVLRLFDGAQATAMGTVVTATLRASEARRRLLSPRDPRSLVHREVLSPVLSIVYLPIWTVEITGTASVRSVALDGVTGAAVLGAAVGPSGACDGSEAKRPPVRTLALRPLQCPNCGTSLPLRPDDLVFRCVGCARAWLAEASRLFEVPQALIEAPAGTKPARHLPVWELTDGTTGRRAYAPAFRCRRLRALTDLATRLVARNPTLVAADDASSPREDLVGCAIDRRDAIALARFAAVGLEEKGVAPVDLRRPSARLLWLPFSHDGYAYCETHTGASFPVRLLDLAA
jgi:DNA-directed RNA polymerase subunit RPC12/RpoP